MSAVFIGGIKYPSLFVADLDSGIRSVSIWKALHKSHGNPAMVHGAFVALESWIASRIQTIGAKEYAAGT
jgi:hypothetical protein